MLKTGLVVVSYTFFVTVPHVISLMLNVNNRQTTMSHTNNVEYFTRDK